MCLNIWSFPADRVSLRLFLGAALFLACLSPGRTQQPVLDLTFDDPQGLIKGKAEGIDRLSPEFSRSTSTVASGQGGRALLQITDGPATERAGKAPDAKVQILSEPSMGTPAFIRFALEGNSVTRSVTTGIVPQSVEQSLSSLVTYENGHAIINGGFDFFFRVASEGGFQTKIVLQFRLGGLSVSLSARPGSNALLLKLVTGEKLIDLDGDKAGDRAGLDRKGENEVVFEPGKIYHAAVVFRTATDGQMEILFCCQPGTGPLKPDETVAASFSGFSILEGNRPTNPEKIVLGIGQNQDPQTFDLARFRIFHPVPPAFPGIDAR